MTNVVAYENESFDSLLKRFNKRVHQDGILAQVRRRQYYEKPSVKRKRKKASKRRKTARVLRRW